MARFSGVAGSAQSGTGPRGGEDDIAVLGVRLARSQVPRLDLRLPAELGSLRTLRDDLAGWLESAGVSDEEAHDLILAAWEAGINAVEHPLAPARREVRISAELKDDEVVLVVRDTGLWKEQVRSSERGRGLPLIRALVDSVSLRARSQGTEVRMRRAVRQRSAVRSRSISGAA